MALSHLLQPKSSIQILRLGFLASRARCCLSLPELKEEDGLKETLPKESPGKNPTFITTPKEVSYTRLTQLSREHKVGPSETAEDQEGIQQSKESLSDVVLDYYAKNINSDSKCLSQPNDYLSVEQASDSHSEELLAESAEIDKQRPPTFLNGISELSNDPPHTDYTESMPDIKELISILGIKKRALSSSIGSKNNEGPVKKSSLNGNVVKISKRDNKRDFKDGVPKIEDEEMGNSKVKPVDFTDGKERTKVLVPTRNKDESQLNGTSFSREASEENRVLVRFLHNSITKEHVLAHFYGCGEILDVEFHNAGGSQFNTAYIYFMQLPPEVWVDYKMKKKLPPWFVYKGDVSNVFAYVETKTGLMKALKKSGSCLVRWVITVESPISSMEIVKIPTSQDLDIPAELIKNPIRTIKIEQLTRKISSYHIKEALAFCESNISGYFLGPANSVAYVEFETEIGKERALAKQFINVFGKRLTMFRVDPPITTVVRLSNIQSLEMSKILSVCKDLGGIRQPLQRNDYTLDVHFELAEWPNMLKILNSLNGYEIEGIRLQAEPAPIFPTDVLIALWHQPDGRKLLRATAQGLLHRIGENTLGTSEFASSLHEFLR